MVKDMVMSMKIRVDCCHTKTTMLECAETKAVFKCNECGMIYTLTYNVEITQGFGISVQPFEKLPMQH